MKKFILLLLLIPAFAVAQTDTTKVSSPTQEGAILQEGTIIKAALTKSINGKEVNVGDIVELELSEDIVISDKVAVSKGAKVTGLVTEAERAKSLGRKGKLAFSIDYLYMANGKVIKLRSQIEKNIKSSTTAVVAGAVLLAPVALFIHGKNAKYEKGEVFSAYVDKETKL
jgi:hypothetical protein